MQSNLFPSPNRLILGLFAFLMIISTGCMQYEDVDIGRVEQFSVSKFEKDAIEIDVAMRIKNPNNYKITITGSDFDVFMDDKNMGTAKIKNAIVLPAESDELQTFTVQTDQNLLMKGGISSLFSMLGKRSPEVRLKGEIKAKARFLSKTFPVDITERVKL